MNQEEVVFHEGPPYPGIILAVLNDLVSEGVCILGSGLTHNLPQTEQKDIL